MPAWLDAVMGDPPAKPQIPAWLQKAFATDATSVARAPRPQLPQPTIGPLAVQNRRPGGTAIPRPQPALPVDDQGVMGSGQGQSLFDVLPGLGAARGVKAGVDVAKAGHLPLGLLLAAGSILPEGGAVARKLGGAVARGAEEKIARSLLEEVPQIRQADFAAQRSDPIVAAAIRTPDGRYFEGPTHGHAFLAMEDAGEGALAEQMQRSNSKFDLFKTKSGQYVTRDELGKELGRRPVSELMQLDESPLLVKALDENGGFSYDPRTARFVKSGGVMVGGVPGQKGMVVEGPLTKEHLDAFRAANADLLKQDGMMIGGWRDGPKTYLDVSQKVHRDDAPALLKARGEKAGWDLDKGEELANPHANGAVSAGAIDTPANGAQNSPMETISRRLAAAVRSPEGKISRGVDHAAAFERTGLDYNDPAFDQYDQGFVTNTGRFVSREEAAQIAKREGRLKYPETFGDDPSVHNIDLMSEDLKPSRGSPLEAPAVSVPERWKPTERGVFDRSAPKIQGTAQLDPRMAAQMPRGESSPLADAIANSKTVERGLLADTERGLPFGGDVWYETGPIKAHYDAANGPLTFRDWLNASGAGSIQNPTHNEPASASILLYAKRHGITPEEAMAEFKRRFPDASTPWMSKGIAANFARADELGGQFPSKPGAGERKVPWYTHGKEGGSIAGEAALDTHERRRLVQLAAENPRLAKLLKQSGITALEGPKADVVPIKNALDYAALSSPYRRIAERLGLPSTQAAQAGRWLGGGAHTGLASQPFGDYVQTLEDGLLYTARTRGLDESPRGLRSLWDAISQGEDFFMPLYSRKGGYPVY